MRARGPTWHAGRSCARPVLLRGARLVSALVVAGAALCGCFDMHGRPAPAVDAGAAADAPRRADAPALIPPDAPDSPPPPPDRCAEAMERIRRGEAPSSMGCDGRTFPRECLVPAGLCCQLVVTCRVDPGDGGTLEAWLTCDDWCDQSCAGQSLDDCALFPYCERFEPGACGPAPPGVIEGPACIGRRGAPCATDAECPDGARCLEHWVNPCAGLPCDACGGTARWCA